MYNSGSGPYADGTKLYMSSSGGDWSLGVGSHWLKAAGGTVEYYMIIESSECNPISCNVLGGDDYQTLESAEFTVVAEWRSITGGAGTSRSELPIKITRPEKDTP